MKPDWDKLAAEYKSHPTVLVADVDCTTSGGKAKCEEVGVRGYPSIKHGDPESLEDYKGGRDLATLKKFAEGLGNTCGPANMDMCEEAKKKQIEEYTELGEEKREQMIAEKEAELTKVEEDFKTFVEGLQAEYKEEVDKKEKRIADAKADGSALVKAVHAFEKKSKQEL